MKISINLQIRSKSVGEAKERFKQSCTICCANPDNLWKRSCERCPLASRHRETVAELKGKGATV